MLMDRKVGIFDLINCTLSFGDPWWVSPFKVRALSPKDLVTWFEAFQKLLVNWDGRLSQKGTEQDQAGMAWHPEKT